MLIIDYTSWCAVSSFFPGDKNYRLDTEAENKMSTDRQPEDPQGYGLHRMLISDSYTINLQITITPKYSHLLPVVGQVFSNDSKSQL